ncbi:MAG: hypothetical protein QW760_02690 [Thermofilaceae archaeon]
MNERHRRDSSPPNPGERGDPNGKASIEFLRVELIKAVEAARAVLEEAGENQLTPSSPQSALSDGKSLGRTASCPVNHPAVENSACNK